MGKEKSRPPAYPPYLKALLTTSLSRTSGKPVKKESLQIPPSLPGDRIDPESDAARLLGRVSKRREVNARWRFFTEETQRILPPLQVSSNFSEKGPPHGENASSKAEGSAIGGAFQNSGVLDALIRMAGKPEDPPEPTKGLRRESQGIQHGDSGAASANDITLPSRSLRRLHRELLGRIPVLTQYIKSGGKEIFEVHPPRGAHSPAMRYSTANIPEIDDTNLAWVLEAEKKDNLKSKAER